MISFFFVSNVFVIILILKSIVKSFDPAGGAMVCYSQSHCTFEQCMSAFPYKSQRLKTHSTATLHPSCSAELSSASVHCIAMKDQLERYLLPTADLQKAIDRNAKQGKDLSLVAIKRKE